MNATYETFSNHSRTSTNDIAFLTIADISEQMRISKSKLYKDIREGRLVAEKSLDDTLVVSPSALKSAYEHFDTSIFFESDFPAPDCLGVEDDPLEGLNTEDIFDTPYELSHEDSDDLVPEEIAEDVAVDTETHTSPPENPSKSAQKGPNLLPGAKMWWYLSAVIFCSAILIGVMTKF